jgi:hydrogenase maturation protein HypF
MLRQMIAKGVNSPQTSSLGRLFDGVAAIIGLRDRVNFEGQAAMELEMIADEQPSPLYTYRWTDDSVRQIPTAPIIRDVVADISRGIAPETISGKFHRTLIRLFAELCGTLRKETGIDRVVMSGGVFLNAILLAGLHRSLKDQGFHVYAHRAVPTNDGGISLGQAVAAAAMAAAEATGRRVA